jgi:hypothetical protein
MTEAVAELRQAQQRPALATVPRLRQARPGRRRPPTAGRLATAGAQLRNVRGHRYPPFMEIRAVPARTAALSAYSDFAAPALDAAV